LTNKGFLVIVYKTTKDNKMKAGITKSGDSTEERLISLVPSAKENPDKSWIGKSKGDAIVSINNKEYYIEIKKTTWNQTRPSKYLPCVGHDPNDDVWIVVPPDEVMKMATGRSGQHTKNPFVCVGLGKTNAKRFEEYRCEESELEEKIHEAILQGEKNKKMKKAAETLRQRELDRVKEDNLLIENILTK
jgi:hypothetical protein